MYKGILMAQEIAKISIIKNMAVFNDFKWDSTVKDNGNTVAEFKKVNMLYGRNYSGKTTLSRIFRAFETGVISDKYASPEFNFLFTDNSSINQSGLKSNDMCIRVFNEDFVRENLQFIVDPEKLINSFAILGENNNKLEEEIEQKESELGSEEDKTGLRGQYMNANEKLNVAKDEYQISEAGLEEQLKAKANNKPTGIKHNKFFGDPNYNVNRIKADISKVSSNSYQQLTNEQVAEKLGLLKEESKAKINVSKSFDLKYSAIAENSKELLEKRIQASEPIQDLLDDALLAAWVREGRDYNKDRKSCGFCGNILSSELWGKLDKHFNKESEKLIKDIDALLKIIEQEKIKIPDLFKIKLSSFYSSFAAELEALEQSFIETSKLYVLRLNQITKMLEARKDNIFSPLEFVEAVSVENDLNEIYEKYEKLRIKSDGLSSTLRQRQIVASLDLRLHEVFSFMNDIKYHYKMKIIEKLKAKKEIEQNSLDEVKVNVDKAISHISNLKSQLKDESKGADKVNEYLSGFFGHQYLSLRSVQECNEDGTTCYRFQVTRSGNIAFHLSEGECSLISFCYFMAKLSDIDTKGQKPIIWIDDPISSLDSNHIFFIYSLINAEIEKAKKYSQLFISTHNLDFLKYLKRISRDYKGSGATKVKIREFFLIERTGEWSRILPMPDYMKTYTTEFNYLFHQIYKCAKSEMVDDTNYQDFYNFGNNARKFMEIYLHYKYPNGHEGDNKLLNFFGQDNIPTLLTERINNEYSHLVGTFERGATPMEVPEMKSVADLILNTIKEKDLEQYNAFLRSIDEPKE
jgi:wobble nucleotide-excising tRNase